METNKEELERVVESGDWLIRFDNEGVSYGGFKWGQVGEWVKALDWTTDRVCGGGLHGQGQEASGFRGERDRLVFCETRGQRILLNNKVKVEEARILLINSLPDNLKEGIEK
jgi:hypothetical protein